MEPSAPILPEPDLLDRLVTLVDSSLSEAGWHHPHVLVKVESPSVVTPHDLDSLDLGMKLLPDGCHPVDELWGFVAPESWLAIGLVTYGWASPQSDARPSCHPERQRVRLTVVVDREGRQASTATFEDGSVIDENGEGRVSDVLRLCLGVATAPPPPLSDLADVLWLLAITDACTRRRIGWPSIAALRVAPDEQASTWRAVRSIAAASDRWEGADTWMDDGFFARELLGCLPSVDESLAHLERVLTGVAYRKLVAALSRPG